MLAGVSGAKIDPETAIGLWAFDEGAGGIAGDSSGNGNDGILNGDLKWVEGKFGKALEFNGTDTCVTTEQKLLDSLGEYTIVLWIKPEDVPINRVGFIGQNDAVEFNFPNATTISFWTPTAGGVKPTYNYPKGEWHHLAAVASGESTIVYVDGEIGAQGGPAGPETSDFTVNIGGCGICDATGNWYTGVMDDVAIFQMALEEDDIKKIMNDGLLESLGMAAVCREGKLATSWGKLKTEY
jgi:hypothetical protein